MSKLTDIVDKSIVEMIISTKRTAKQIAKQAMIELLSDTPVSKKNKKRNKR
mgnify:CR=1 FL=1|jgi:hypothetical protein